MHVIELIKNTIDNFRKFAMEELPNCSTVKKGPEPQLI